MAETVVDVPIADVKVERGFYPRSKTSGELVAQYRQDLSLLPPIVVTHENYLVDGWHRLEAYRTSDSRETIPAHIRKIPSDRILEESIRANATFGWQLSRADKKRLAKALCTIRLKAGEKSADVLKTLAELLSVPYSTVSEWTKGEREEAESEENARILDFWIACYTDAAIGEAVRLSPVTIHERTSEITKLENPKAPPQSRQDFTVWEFSECDPAYGQEKYHGRMPGQIVENLLWLFTEPGDCVMDPFAGGGTTYDVCRAMRRRCVSSDIRPLVDRQEVIQKHDVTDGLPPVPLNIKRNGGIALLLLDPPYGQQKRGSYGAEKTNLANLDVDAFDEAMGAIFRQARKVVRPGGRLAVIASASQSKDGITDHALRFASMLDKAGWELELRVIVPYSTQQYTGADVTRARDQKRILQLHRDLLIYRMPVRLKL